MNTTNKIIVSLCVGLPLAWGVCSLLRGKPTSQQPVVKKSFTTAKDNFQKAYEYVLQQEGGLNKHKWDSGGVTQYGISKRFLKTLPLSEADINGDGKVDADDIIELSIEGAAKLYRKHFWDEIKAGGIGHAAVAIKYFDAAVNMGCIQAAILVRRAIARVDGRLECKIKKPETIVAALNKLDPNLFLDAFIEVLVRFYNAVANKKVSDCKWSRQLADRVLTGWIKRARMVPCDQ